MKNLVQQYSVSSWIQRIQLFWFVIAVPLKVSWIDRNCFCEKKVVSNVFKSIKKRTIQNSLQITFYIIHNFFSCFALVYQPGEARK